MSSHMFIQPEQIRAARALLDWSQQDLADASSVSKDTVKNYELSNNKPNTQTLTRIIGALEVAGIEFTLTGLQKRKKEVIVLRGKEGFHKFYDMIYEEVKNSSDLEICVSNVDERKFMEWGAEIIDKHSARMTALKTTFRILISHGDKYFVASEYAKYKWLANNFFSTIPYYLYGTRTALILFQDEPVIYILPEAEITLAYRQQFEAMWLLSEEPRL